MILSPLLALFGQSRPADTRHYERGRGLIEWSTVA